MSVAESFSTHVEAENAETKKEEMTATQKARMERNRQAALLKKQAKQETLSTARLSVSPSKKARTLPKDSGGGFLIEDSEDKPQAQVVIPVDSTSPIECSECGEEFLKSFLRTNFDFPLCNSCRDKELHDLITKTDAKKEYLLQDCDLDKREPPLKFMLKKNPHERAKGDMKLYLRLQVEERAIQVWGSEEQLEEEREKRTHKRNEKSQKAYQKKIKQLRLATRSSLFTRDLSTHEHEFGEPVCVDEDEDLYEKTCVSCGYSLQYEEM
ncbi:DNA repair protein complementing XP-A cells -like protein [Halotydeus destructor]|nr:DNA repair protein complementing XP-A cells -like protein [Halotydeus destructor]